MRVTIQNALAACILSLFLGVFLAVVPTWYYQQHKYEAIIKTNQNVALTELDKAQKATIKQEAINSEIRAKLDQTGLEASKRTSAVRVANNKLVQQHNGMFVPASSCKEAAGASSPASADVTPKAYSCKLSDEATKLLLDESERADKVADYANVCWLYVQQVEQQRQRMIKDNNE